MSEVLFIILLVICLGAAAGALMLTYQMTRDYQSEFINQFFYYLAAYFIFGLYGLWGQVIVRYVLEHFTINASVIETVGGLLPLFGVPFVLVSWVMLMKMALGLADKTVTPIQSLIYFFSTTALLAVVGWSVSSRLSLTQMELYLYAGGELLFYSVFLLISLASVKKIKNSFPRKIYHSFSLLIFLGLILRLVLLPFIFTKLIVPGGALLLYFLGNLLPIWFLRSNADALFPTYTATLANKNSFDSLCTRYRISKREAEIIQLISQGQTNQEIADALFISLQTVKDHNHRIYTKIGIGSRVQLVNLLR